MDALDVRLIFINEVFQQCHVCMDSSRLTLLLVYGLGIGYFVVKSD